MNYKEYFASIKPKHPDYIEYIDCILEKGYGWDDLRDVFVKGGMGDDAVELAKVFHKYRGDVASSHTFLADTFEEIEDIKSAIDVYEKAISGNHRNATKLNLKYAKLAEEYYDEEKVIKIYEDFLRRKKSGHLHRNYFEYLLATNKLDLAEVQGLEVIQLYGDKSHSIRFKLSEVYENKGEVGKAKDQIKYLISKNVNNGKAWKKLKELESQYPDDEVDSKIVRMIEFSPEYHAAGISILQNFGKLLRERYKNTPVKVSIIQEGLAVKMVVVPPDGKKVEVEEYLHQYGLVVKGEMLPEELLNDPAQVFELKTELKLAQTRIELQREQMQFMNSQNTSRILSLEDQVSWLRTQVGSGLEYDRENYKEILVSLRLVHENNSNLLNRLVEAINTDSREDAKKLVEIIKAEEPESYGKLKQFVSNTISSAGANAPAWVEFMSKVIPP